MAKFGPGDHIEFDNFEDPSVKMHCVVQNYLEPDDEGFKGGYHVACYYVVPEEDVRPSDPDSIVLVEEKIVLVEDKADEDS